MFSLIGYTKEYKIRYNRNIVLIIEIRRIMMKEITFKKLNQYESNYNQDHANTVLRRALAKNAITDIAHVSEREMDQNHYFSLELETLSANNQKATGRCWLFAGLNVLREVAAKKYNVKDIEFSQNYQAFYDKFEKINYFIQSMDDFLHVDGDDRTLKHLLEQGIQDGGQWDMFVSLVKKYGIVIKEAMPETHSSSNSRGMNRLINLQLKKYACDARKLASENRLNELEQLKEDTLSNLYGFLVTNLGVPPKTFNFEYVDKDKVYHMESNLDPVKFYEGLEMNLDDYVSVINAPTKDKPFNKSYTVSYLGNVIGGKEIRHLNIEMNRLVELVLSQLKDKEVVWFGADVSFDNNREKGIWDDKQFDYNTTFKMNFNMTKEERLDYVSGAMNHAMVITGVNLIGDEPTKWRIENSWGVERGNKGYYLMSQTWFLEHTYQAVIHKKHLTEAELKSYHQTPIILKPWDPMGSLA